MISPDDPLPPSKEKLELINESGRVIEVLVEMIPECYVLQPKDRMSLFADVKDAPRNEGYSVRFLDGLVQVYAAWDAQPAVFINDQRVNSDFIAPTSSSIN